MRKFIVSDFHGFGNVYYSIMNYLDNISKEEEIELYINGDLFDRGYESVEILLDLKKRIEDNKYKIIYLGGNHELMMYQFFQDEEKNRKDIFNQWYCNGGAITHWGLEEEFNYNKNKVNNIVDFVSNLKIYHKFQETINNKPIVLAHAACPAHVRDKCHIRIKDNNYNVSYITWTRLHNISSFLGAEFIDPIEQRIGNDKYFTIIGHTPVDNKYGFEYNKKQNYLNIDGGSAAYVSGEFNYDHFPLVEILNDKLKILTFNSNNEIIYGNIFVNKIVLPISEEELNIDREYINKDLVMNELAVDNDGIVYYKSWDNK